MRKWKLIFLSILVALVGTTLFIRFFKRNLSSYQGNKVPIMGSPSPKSDTVTLLDETIELTGKETQKFSISVPHTTRFGISLVAPQSIQSSLIDPNGKISKSVKANSKEANEPFIYFSVDNPMIGIWTLQLSNTIS